MALSPVVRIVGAILFLSSASLHAADLKKITFKTNDGQTLYADFAPPSKGKPTVVMLHGLGSSRGEWYSWAEYLQKKGWGVLAYDARGHGDSSKTKDPNGSANGYKSFGQAGPGSAWEKMINDVGAAIKAAKAKGATAIFLEGASLGANVSLSYAALTSSVRGVVLLSPGLNYAEIKTETPAKKIKGTPVLLVASSQDGYAFQSSKLLTKLISGSKFWSDVKPGHGVQMLDPSLMKRIFGWLEKQA